MPTDGLRFTDVYLSVSKETTPKLVIAIAVLLAIVAAMPEFFGAKRLPKPRAITVVLVMFGILLLASCVVYVGAVWSRLATPEAKDQFLMTALYAVFLFILMIGGMFAKYFYDLFQSGQGFPDAKLKDLLMPLLVSLMVFYPLWVMAAGSPKNLFPIIAAFQNGFFWQTIFSRVQAPPPPPGGDPAAQRKATDLTAA